MKEPPTITIVDPSGPGEPADVLEAGSERPPFRLPRKLLLLALTVALVAVGTFVGQDRYRLHQSELRRKAAALVLADTMHVHVQLGTGGVTALDGADDYERYAPDGSSSATDRPPPAVGELDLALSVRDDAGSFDTVSGAFLEGSDLSLTFDSTRLDNRVSGTSVVTTFPMAVQCGAVAAGHYPRLGSLVLIVVPESGRRHRVVLPLTSSTSTKQLALTACNLPDPAAVPTATIEEQNGRLLLEVAGVPRTPSALQIQAVTSPGFALIPIGGNHPIPPNVNMLLDVSVRLTSCAAARAGNGVVTLTLRDGNRAYTVVATDAPPASFRRSGVAWLRTQVARSC